MELVVKMRQAGMEPDRKLKHVLKSVATKSDKLEEYAATFGGYVSENTIVKDERWAAAEAAIPAPAAGAKYVSTAIVGMTPFINYTNESHTKKGSTC
jgi:hypothetical protein